MLMGGWEVGARSLDPVPMGELQMVTTERRDIGGMEFETRRFGGYPLQFFYWLVPNERKRENTQVRPLADKARDQAGIRLSRSGA
jgi:hypothetical protein